jgi:acetyltransferase-like isoleucine patch superfamily enzyme
MFSAHPGGKLTIGDDCGFSGTVIGAFKEVKIGNKVRCGANTLVTDSDWHLDDPRSTTCRPVIIGDNVWLGEGVKILKGVNIGCNTIVGSGSVVTKDLPPNVIAAGNPCKVIRDLSK